MKVADYIASYLHRRGVSHVFEMSGGMITFLLDALHRQAKVAVVSTHHEQSAAFAADAFGRMTGVPGVAMATSGPGATNLLTGIGSCHFDSSPAVFITGQVNRHEQKGDRAIRQLGFQETDIVAMARPITKGARLANDPESLPALLDEAFHLAVSGRPGPCCWIFRWTSSAPKSTPLAQRRRCPWPSRRVCTRSSSRYSGLWPSPSGP